MSDLDLALTIKDESDIKFQHPELIIDDDESCETDSDIKYSPPQVISDDEDYDGMVKHIEPLQSTVFIINIIKDVPEDVTERKLAIDQLNRLKGKKKSEKQLALEQLDRLKFIKKGPYQPKKLRKQEPMKVHKKERESLKARKQTLKQKVSKEQQQAMKATTKRRRRGRGVKYSK